MGAGNSKSLAASAGTRAKGRAVITRIVGERRNTGGAKAEAQVDASRLFDEEVCEAWAISEQIREISREALLARPDLTESSGESEVESQRTL